MKKQATRQVFKPSPRQEEFLAAIKSRQYQYILFGGAIRGGKTYAGIGALIGLASTYPLTRWAIVRHSLPTLRRTTIPSFMKICPDYFLAGYNQETNTVTCANGSQIIFFSEGYDDDKELNRWKGLEVNGFLLEEANELQEASFYKAIERAGSHIPRKGKKPPPLILLTCNPTGNWVKTLFYDRWVNNTLPEGWLYIPSKITDNPYIMADEKYVASLQNMPRYQYEVYVQGNWDIRLKTGGEFYKCFELDRHVAPAARCRYNPNLALHISWDDNVNPYLPLGIFQLEGSKVIMIDEIAGITPANTIKAVCAEFIRRYPAHRAGLFIYGDATADKEDTKQEKGHSFYRIVM